MLITNQFPLFNPVNTDSILRPCGLEEKIAWKSLKQLGKIGDHKCPKEIALGLQNCANELTKWNNVVFAQIPKIIQEKRKTQFSYYLGKKMGSYGVDIYALKGDYVTSKQ